MRYIPMLLMVVACATARGDNGRTPVDQVPMYGGMDRSSIPELKAGDEKLIQDAIKSLGSREAASKAFVNKGFDYYQQDDLSAAMRRFNQAWLLNPDNPEVYWGFASVLNDQAKYCEGLRLMELGLAKGPIQQAYIPDHAFLYAACAGQGDVTPQQRLDYLGKSSEIFTKAEANPTIRKPYLYFQWTRAHYAAGEYAAAWGTVREYRKHTSAPFSADLLRELSAKMPEPR